jgi:hypothetical protein
MSTSLAFTILQQLMCIASLPMLFLNIYLFIIIIMCLPTKDFMTEVFRNLQMEV